MTFHISNLKTDDAAPTRRRRQSYLCRSYAKFWLPVSVRL